MIPVLVNSANFQREVLGAEQPVVVDFYGPSRMECGRLEQVVHRPACALHDQTKICLLNATEAPEIDQQYHIMHSQTLVFFKKGQPVATFFRYPDAAHLSVNLQRVLEA